MKDNEFRQLVDREFASLEWTDEQRMNTLRLMRQPERNIMKKKLITGIAIAMTILLTSLTAFAAGMNIITIHDMLAGLSDQDLRESEIIVPVDENKVASAYHTRHTSDLVDVEITQLYLSGERLYLTASITPTGKDTLVYHEPSLPLTLDGQEMRYFDLYRQKDLTLLNIFCLDIDWEDMAFSDTRPGDVELLYSTAIHDEATLGMTLLCVYEWPDTLHALEAGFRLQASFVVKNARTNNLEWNVLFADVPRMERVPVAE